MPAGVNSTEGSQVGTSTSLGQRRWPFVSKKARYFSRSSSVLMVMGAALEDWKNPNIPQLWHGRQGSHLSRGTDTLVRRAAEDGQDCPSHKFAPSPVFLLWV